MRDTGFGKRLCLFLFCFAIACGIGYQIGGALPQMRVVLMPQEILADTSIGALFCAVSAGLAQTALVLAAWYLVCLVSIGNKTVAKVAFPLFSAYRGYLLGICLSMVDGAPYVLSHTASTHTVLGNAIPGLLGYLAGSVILMCFAAGHRENTFGICRMTGRFLTYAGAVFTLTLCLGLV